MPAIDEAKARRDAALQVWRHELGLLRLCKPGSSEWTKQSVTVENARAVYSKAAEEYMQILLEPDRPNQERAS